MYVAVKGGEAAIANAHRARFTKREGVVLLGLAQEKQRSFKAQKRRGPQGGVTFGLRLLAPVGRAHPVLLLRP